MRLAVCTADRAEGERLAALLEQLRRELCTAWEADWMEDPGALLERAGAEGYGMVLLDGDLPDCVETGLGLRRGGLTCPILLFAKDSRLALLGYAVHPEGFLLKPVDYRVLRRAMERCRRAWQEECQALWVSVGRARMRIAWADVFYLKVSGRTLTVHGRYGSLETRMSLAGVEEQLREAPFVKCQRSCLVNLFQARACWRECLELEGGVRIPISEDKWETVRESWLRFREENPLWAGEEFVTKNEVS